MEKESSLMNLLKEEGAGKARSATIIVKKVCMLGDPSVGKTSLVRRFVYDVFDDKYIETIGAKVTKKNIRVLHKASSHEFELRLMIWDIAGHDILKFVKPSYYRDAEGGILVCDVTRRETLENISRWNEALTTITGKIPLILFANKVDLKDSMQVTEEDVKKKAEEIGAYYLFTSAKTGEGVEKGFRGLGLALIKAFLKNQSESRD